MKFVVMDRINYKTGYQQLFPGHWPILQENSLVYQAIWWGC